MRNLKFTTVTNIVYSVPYRTDELEMNEYRIIEVNDNNVSDISAFRTNDVINQFKKLLDSGQKGYYLYDKEGNCMAHGWLAVNNTNQNIKVNGYINLPPNSALVHHCNINSRYRGKGLYKFLLKEIYRLTPERINIVIDTNENNIAARKGIEKSGAVEDYRVRIYKINSRVLYSKRINSNK